MSDPKVIRPTFPPGYVEHPTGQLTWDYVEQQLTEVKHYWLCSTRPDGRPHVVPRWCVYLDRKIFYDGSSQTRHAQNIALNPNVALHLEDGEKAIILEGTSVPAGKPERDLALRLAAAYKKKYAELGYAPKPDQWDEGGLYVFIPRQCIAWTVFTENPTKFVFD